MVDPSTAAERPRKSGGVVTLLVLLTLINGIALLTAVVAVVDEVGHGGDWDDEVLRALLFLTFVGVLAMVALAGAWFTRKWGPRLYVLMTGFGLLFGLIVSGGAGFSPLNLVGVALAIGLWWKAETDW